MEPIAFQIGPLVIRWYGVMAAAGLLLGGVLLNSNRKYLNMTSDQCSNALLVAIISGIIGARIFYVVQFFHLYRDNLWEIIRIDRGGLVFYGGFLLAMAALAIYSRIAKLDMLRLLDGMTPALAVGHAFGRIGCFLNCCCFGSPTTLPWGVCYPPGSEAVAKYGNTPLHPVQLYEAGENLLLAILYFHLVRKAPRGVPLAAYMLTYGVMRFINEYARGDNPRFWGLFTPAQLIGMAVVTAGALLMFFSLKKRKKVSEEA